MKPAMIQTMVRLRRSQHIAIQKLSRELHISIASLVRTAIDFALDDFHNNKFPFRSPKKETPPHAH